MVLYYYDETYSNYNESASFINYALFVKVQISCQNIVYSREECTLLYFDVQ